MARRPPLKKQNGAGQHPRSTPPPVDLSMAVVGMGGHAGPSNGHGGPSRSLAGSRQPSAQRVNANLALPGSGGLPPVGLAIQSCVKVQCTAVAPFYALPWLRGTESHTSGSGYIVELRTGELRVLTNAQARCAHPRVASTPRAACAPAGKLGAMMRAGCGREG